MTEHAAHLVEAVLPRVPVLQWVLALPYLAKLAALTPRPEINLLIYHGVLAPHARWRSQVVGYGRAAPAAVAGDPAEARRPPPPRRGNWTWATLMRRAFAVDVLACPRCGNRLRVVATVEDPAAVRQYLATRRPPETLGPGPPASALAKAG